MITSGDAYFEGREAGAAYLKAISKSIVDSVAADIKADPAGPSLPKCPHTSIKLRKAWFEGFYDFL